jgi:hypothetical protein
MFPPVESQVIFLSKETPIVSVGLRTAEVSYTNQYKTAWKSEVVQTLGWPLPICVQTFPCVNESFWLAKCRKIRQKDVRNSLTLWFYRRHFGISLMDRYPIHIYGQGTRLVLSLKNYDFRWSSFKWNVSRVLTGFLIGWNRLFSQSKSPLELSQFSRLSIREIPKCRL